MLLVGLCAVGCLAGLCCGVAVLLPLSLLAAALEITTARVFGSAAHTVDIVIGVAVCQAGYMIGLTGQSALAEIIARYRAAPSKRA